MASITATLALPDGFPDVLREYTRELLRDQPADIYAWSAAYFGARAPAADLPVALELDLDGLRAQIEQLFVNADKGNKGFLSRIEARKLIESLSGDFKLTDADIRQIMAEADENDDGLIEFGEFIPLALEVMEALYAKSELHRQKEQAYAEAEDVLMHGLTQEQFEATLSGIFAKADVNGDGRLNKVEFRNILKEAGIGFTRKELNSIMHECDTNDDGLVDMNEFIPIAMSICRDVLAREIVAGKLPTKEAEAAAFLLDLFFSADKDGSGYLPRDSLSKILTDADLGLSHVQTQAMVSESAADDDGMVQYESFAVTAATMFTKIFDFRLAENAQ
jgi:Ca2+-binding EF-hand superfamily protein